MDKLSKPLVMDDKLSEHALAVGDKYWEVVKLATEAVLAEKPPGVSLTYGQAVRAAAEYLGLAPLPDEVEAACLQAVFKVTVSGFPTNVKA